MNSNSKQDTTSQQSSNTSPWAPQANALTDAFSNAQTAYGKSSGATAPTDFTAQMTPAQLATFNSMLGYGNANSGVPGAEASAGASMTGAGSSATSGALSALGGFNPATANNPQTLIDQANKYVDGQNIDGQVSAAMLPAMQQVRDATLPQMTSAAAGTGNINSSSAGVGGTAQGVVERGLAEQAAGLGSSMRGQAFGQGLNLASSNANSNNTAMLDALLGRASAGTTAASAGGGLTSDSVNNAGGIFNIANAGGAGQQGADQANLTNQQQQYQSKVSSPYDSLNGLMGIIGQNNWGSQSTGSGTSTTTSTPSAWQVIGGLMSSAGSLVKSDRNAKEDIVEIGKLFDGQPVYRYRYKGEGPRVHIGLMAQDVEQHTPDAVVEISGVKHVDYGIATQNIV